MKKLKFQCKYIEFGEKMKTIVADINQKWEPLSLFLMNRLFVSYFRAFIFNI